VRCAWWNPGRNRLAELARDGECQLDRCSTTACISVLQRDSAGGSRVTGQLLCVDMCGTERQRKTALCGKTLKEAARVGMACGALANVLGALEQGKTYIPYRNSKITRICANALGGNSATAFIFCVSPLARDAEETIATLRYARRAQNIANKRNAVPVTDRGLARSISVCEGPHF
jgi:hypothetical protein